MTPAFEHYWENTCTGLGLKEDHWATWQAAYEHGYAHGWTECFDENAALVNNNNERKQ